MTDAEFTSWHLRVKRQVDGWVKVFPLTAWDIQVRYHRTTAAFVDDTPDEVTAVAAGCAIVRWEYAMATLHFNLERMESCGYTGDDIERSVVHEYMHLLLNEVRPQEPTGDWLDHEEHAASMLAYAFQETRNAFRPAPVTDEY